MSFYSLLPFYTAYRHNKFDFLASMDRRNNKRNALILVQRDEADAENKALSDDNPKVTPDLLLLLSWCFTSTETVRVIRDWGKSGIGKEFPGHLPVHTAPELRLTSLNSVKDSVSKACRESER